MNTTMNHSCYNCLNLGKVVQSFKIGNTQWFHYGCAYNSTGRTCACVKSENELKSQGGSCWNKKPKHAKSKVEQERLF